MANVVLRSDIDGRLFHCPDASPPRYAKALSTAVAWHVFEVRDLEEAASDIVESVTTAFDDGVHWINYRPAAQPLHLLALRDLLHLDGPLVAWRSAKLALELAGRLEALHDAELWQLVVHPGRVAELGGRLALLPTLAGVLAPLPEILPNMDEGWLHYIAPEVLRTRAMHKGMLAAGDVYALGRLIEAMCVSTSAAELVTSPFDLAERRVERLDRDPFGTFPPSLAGLADLVAAMCSPLPRQRPALRDVMASLDRLCAEHVPERRFADLVRRQSFDEARLCYLDFKDAEAEAVFGVTARSVRLMAADLALAASPPDCNAAVFELRQAEAADQYEADVQLRLGRAYALWTTFPQYLASSSRAYALAAALSEWKHEIIVEWAEALLKHGPQALLAHTGDIPPEVRPPSLVELRARCMLDLDDASGAWDELALVFPRRECAENLFDLAHEVACTVNPGTLMSWLQTFRERPDLAGLAAIAWHVSGNAELAERCLEQARAYRP